MSENEKSATENPTQLTPDGIRFRRVVAGDGRHGVLDLAYECDGGAAAVAFYASREDGGTGKPEVFRWLTAKATKRGARRGVGGNLWLVYTSGAGDVRTFRDLTATDGGPSARRRSASRAPVGSTGRRRPPTTKEGS